MKTNLTKENKDKKFRDKRKKEGMKLFRVWIPEEYLRDVSDLTKEFLYGKESKK